MRVPRSRFVEPIEIETYSGEGAYGPVYASPVTLMGNVDAQRVLTRNAEGDEVTAEMVLLFAPEDQAKVQPESRVTVYGRAARVITVKPYTTKGLVVMVEATTT